LTIRERRSGIMRSTPSQPPVIATSVERRMSRSYPMTSSAGSVNAAPAAIDSPAEPTVWVMLFSRIDPRLSARKIGIESTAIGIDADTVSPTLRPR
jgi:hypothetical protein